MNFAYLFLLNAAADVQEVGRLAAVQLDDVHGGHGEASSVHQTANVAIQLKIGRKRND